MGTLEARRLMMQGAASGGGLMIDGVLVTSMYEEVYVASSIGAGRTITLNHNLGKKPKMVIGMPEGDISGRTSVFAGMLVILDTGNGPIGTTTGYNPFGCQSQVSGGSFQQTNWLYAITADESTLSFTVSAYVHPNVKIHFYVYA